MNATGSLPQDEHVSALRSLFESEAMKDVAEIILNWNAQLTHLPPSATFRKLRRLKKLSLAGCDSLTTLPATRSGVQLTKPIHLRKGFEACKSSGVPPPG